MYFDLLTSAHVLFLFSFDAAYGEESSQEEIFKTEIEPNIPPILKGLNTTILAYGNTGAGKTFTMQGSETNPGIIQRSAENLLNLVAKV